MTETKPKAAPKPHTAPEPGKLAKIAIGTTQSLTATPANGQGEGIDPAKPGKWTVSSGAVVITSEDLTGPTVEIVGAMLGRAHVSYQQPVVLTQDQLAAAQIYGAGSDYMHSVETACGLSYDIEVVPEGAIDFPLAAPVPSSEKFDGLIPMTEPQEKASEKTPYGIGLNDLPVAPAPSFVNPYDDSSVARQSEDAVAKSSPEGQAKAAEEAEKEEKDAKKGQSAPAEHKAPAADHKK